MTKTSTLITLSSILFLSNPIWAEIKSCTQIEDYTLTNKAPKWPRKQAELAAMIYKLTYPDWDFLPSKEKIQNMSNEELNEFGEGIYIGDVFTKEGESYDYAQFGFGGGNWLAIFLEKDTTRLATRIFEWDGDCQILGDNFKPFVDHLKEKSYYSADSSDK